MRALPKRWWVVAAGLGLMSLIAPTTAAASGGGGCGGPVTDRSGARVRIEAFCFTPTILRVALGEVVTFSNMDPVPHSVLGANASWGDYAGFKNRDVMYRFSEPGVYPYLCTYHIGMLGAVVVGNGVGDRSGVTTADGPVTKVDASALELSDAAMTGSVQATEDDARPVLLAGLLALLLGTVAATVVRRRRRRASA